MQAPIPARKPIQSPQPMALHLKVTPKNIIQLWFGAHTPIQKYKIIHNPALWAACLRVHETFRPPSGATSVQTFSRADRVLFANLVMDEFNRTTVPNDVRHVTEGADQLVLT